LVVGHLLVGALVVAVAIAAGELVDEIHGECVSVGL